MFKLSQPMKRMLQFTLLAFALIFGSRFVVIAYKMLTMFRYAEAPAQTVSTVAVKSLVRQQTLAAIGSLKAVNGAELHAKANGTVQSVHFDSGQSVQKDQLLIRLNSDVELADLASAKAAAHLSDLNAKRAAVLIRSHAISQAEFDDAIARQQQALANVHKAEAMVALKTISAPFAGKTGIRQVNVGQYVDVTMPLISLQVLDPLYVQFYMPEQSLKQLYVGQIIRIQADGQTDVIEGKVNAVNATISEQTRTVNVQAVVYNPRGILYPGMFVNVTILLKKEPPVLVIPQTALDYTAEGESVFVMYDDKNKKGEPVIRVKHKIVHAAGMVDDKVIIKDGLVAGEIVVSCGQLKLHDGLQVTINNEVSVDKSKSPATPY